MADWTRDEVAAIVPDYFDMLTRELSGQYYNKSEHRRNLIGLLNNRSHGLNLLHFGGHPVKP